MKIVADIPAPEKIAVVAAAEQKKTQQHIGKVRLHKGQQLYELDLQQQLIFIPKVEAAAVDIHGQVRKKYVVREGCLYTTAINVKNAERKFLKMLDT